MSDLIRDSTFGYLLNYFTSSRAFPYPEQSPSYIIPPQYLISSPADTLVGSPVDGKVEKSTSPTSSGDKAFTRNSTIATVINPSLNASTRTLVPQERGEVIRNSDGGVSSAVPDLQQCRFRRKDGTYDAREIQAALEKGEVDCEDYRQALAVAQHADVTHTPLPTKPGSPLVDWDGPDDPLNPKNWSLKKRLFVTLQICILTFAVYAGSAIYTPSIPGIMVEFDVGLTAAVAGLSLFVFGYGIGPMLLTPLQELPTYGRTPIYIIAIFLFTIFQLPIIYAPNIGTILVFRFLSGFIGSPALATGGATLIDMWPEAKVPYAIAAWAMGAVCGPVLGPVMAGFAAMNKGWQWPMFILLWASSLATISLFFFLPETLASTILLRKAQRLREVSGNKDLRSQSEIDAANIRISDVFKDALVMPLRLLLEPAVFVVSLYLGLVYSIFYLFFESFPLIYSEGGVYNWNLGVSQLPFIAFAITAVITFVCYVYYQKYRIGKLYATGKFTPEDRLEIGLIASFSIPVVTLIFGWTARKGVHWIVPVIFGSLYLPGVYLSFQSILVYLPTIYGIHAGSVLAANDLFRSTLASVFPLFGHQFYQNLGLGPGSTLLAGLSALMIPLFWLIKRNGATLRARSKFAQ